MSLKPGAYTIRWIPEGATFPIIRGVYATGKDYNQSIVTQALRPSDGGQVWNVRPILGQNNLYAIELNGANEPIAGWSIDKSSQGEKTPVVLSSALAIWIISLVDEENSVYQITEPTALIGATPAVDNVDNRLYVKSYVIYPDAPPFPKWQFNRVERN